MPVHGMDRRRFLLTGSATAFLAQHAFAAPETTHIDALQWDRKRILTAADKYLSEKPLTITSVKAVRSEGGLHDYFSEGDYWWPDPKNPTGPYIRRDGESNPDNFVGHRDLLIRVGMIVPALVCAWRLTHEEKYANAAMAHLRAWFVAPETRMNPNLEYAQAIHGVTKGRGIGIIDTLQIVEAARAASFLLASPLVKEEEGKAVRQWFTEYLTWMTESMNGQAERDEKNNHGTCWTLQAAEFARFTHNDNVMSFCRSQFKNKLVRQIGLDGSFPLELARTKPYSYSLFNLDVMATTCEVLSADFENLWDYNLPDGRGMRSAVAFYFPFIANKAKWPYKADVEYFDALPARDPSLLFAARAYQRPEYLEVWKRLNPDPTVPEIIRNFPIRQPALWTVRPPT